MRFLAFCAFVALLVVGFLALDPSYQAQRADNASYQQQLHAIELERRQLEYRERQALSSVVVASDGAMRLGALLLGGIVVFIVFDMYRQRRRPLVRFAGEFVSRRSVEDDELVSLLAEKLRLAGLANIEAARNPGTPHVFSPHLARNYSSPELDVVDQVAAVSASVLQDVQLASASRLLADWRDRKLICQSTNSLLLGFDKAIGSIEPSSGVYLTMGEESDVSLLAVSGDSGSGKTSTMRFLLGQCAMNGAALILCDPHGRKNSQSLVQSCGPLAGSFLIPPAISWDEIREAVATVDRIGRNRLNDADDMTPVVLVLDEFNDTARNMPDFKVVANLLNNIGRSYRKVAITCFLVVHNWRVQQWQDGTLKDSVQGVLFHRLAKAESKLFVSDPVITQQIAYLPAGDGLFFKRGQPRPLRLTGIPYVSRDTLDQARDLFVSAPRTLASMQTDTDGLTDGPADAHTDAVASVLSAYAGVSPSVRASVRAPVEYVGAGACVGSDPDADAGPAAHISELVRVRVYLEAFVLAGLTREQARERLAARGLSFANSEWTLARQSLDLREGGL